MAHVHNIFEVMKEAASSGQGDDSLTISGLDSVLVDASVVVVQGTNAKLSAALAVVDGNDVNVLADSVLLLSGDDISLGFLSGDSVQVAGGTSNVLGFFGTTPTTQQSAPGAVSASAVSGTTTNDAEVLSTLVVAVNDIKAALSNLGLTA